MKKTITSIQITYDNMPQALGEVRNDVSLIRNQLDQIQKCFEPKKPEEYLTRARVAELLNVNLSTLWNWQKQNKLVPVGLGNRIYYKRSDIEAALISLGKRKGGSDD